MTLKINYEYCLKTTSDSELSIVDNYVAERLPGIYREIRATTSPTDVRLPKNQ